MNPVETGRHDCTGSTPKCYPMDVAQDIMQVSDWEVPAVLIMYMTLFLFITLLRGHYLQQAFKGPPKCLTSYTILKYQHVPRL